MSKRKILIAGLALLSSFSLLAFASCNKNTSQPESETESQVQAIESTSGIEYTLSKDGTYYVISGYNGTAKKVVCGDTHKNLPIKEIGDYAFYNANIESVTVADTIEQIGEYAFFNCDYLTAIDLGNGLKSIGEYSFSACKSLTKISLPEGLTRIENSAFYSSSIINVSIPETIEFIGLDAFTSCEDLQYFRYDTAKYLGNADNKYAALIHIVDAVEVEEKSCAVHTDTKVIASGAFENHTTLERVTASKNLVSIGDLAFSGCSKLTSISLPKDLKSIGVSAFAYCTSLKSINLPANLVTLGDGAFSHCSELSVIHIPDSVTEIAPFTFNECSKLSLANIGTGIKTIGAYAFNACGNLSVIAFNNHFNSKLETIGAFAFSGCRNLSTIILPSSLKVVEEKAFVDTLRTIYACHTKAKWVEYGLDNNETLKPYASGTYLYSEQLPDLNSDGTNFDRKYFFVNAIGGIVIWEYTKVIEGITCTYSKDAPALNADGTAYEGNYFYYDAMGTAKKWVYTQA